jgi:hypothetical protein
MQLMCLVFYKTVYVIWALMARQEKYQVVVLLDIV